jgi:diadenosine tetraphosphate (Ap4A) HIT family hydrolase
MGCAIGDGKMLVPGGVIQRTTNFCVHQDPFIPLPGFLVIAAVRHIRSLSQMQATEYEEFSGLVKTTQQAIKEATAVEYLTIVQEESSIHFHLWFFPWTRNVIEQYGLPSLTIIRDIMADQRKQRIGNKEWGELEMSIERIKTLMS